METTPPLTPRDWDMLVVAVTSGGVLNRRLVAVTFLLLLVTPAFAVVARASFSSSVTISHATHSAYMHARDIHHC